MRSKDRRNLLPRRSDRGAVVGGDRCCYGRRVIGDLPAARIQLLNAYLYRPRTWRGALIGIGADADAKNITGGVDKVGGRQVLVQCRAEVAGAPGRAAQTQITDTYAAAQRITEGLRQSVRRRKAAE